MQIAMITTSRDQQTNRAGGNHLSPSHIDRVPWMSPETGNSLWRYWRTSELKPLDPLRRRQPRKTGQPIGGLSEGDDQQRQSERGQSGDGDAEKRLCGWRREAAGTHARPPSGNPIPNNAIESANASVTNGHGPGPRLVHWTAGTAERSAANGAAVRYRRKGRARWQGRPPPAQPSASNRG